VGLGNPGPEYEHTRHNAGFVLADRLASRWQLGPFRRSDRAREARGTWQGFPVRVLKPQTYMNRSGAAIAPLRTLPEFDPSHHLLILVDDVALPLGRFRLRGAGSAGGHNGLKSVIQHVGDQFPRLRIGVGRGDPNWDLADHVLSRFTGDEREAVADAVNRAADAVELFVEDGIEAAMNRFNPEPK